MSRTVAIPDDWLHEGSVYRTIAGDRAGLLSCGIMVKHQAGADRTAGRPDHYSAVWCLRGNGRYRDQQGIVSELVPGSLFHRFTDREHSNDLDPQGRWVEGYLAFGTPLERALVAMRILDPQKPVQLPGLDLVVLRELLVIRDRLYEAPERELPDLLARIAALLIDLIGRERRVAAGPHAAVLDEACRRLAAEGRVDLRRLARSGGLSYERFRKLFRERIGLSPDAYRIRRRIERARALLESSDRPVQAIAAELGYANPFQFSAQFKRLVGMPPAAYRRR
jgi:AraC family transcriptional regulator of arabinose operon